MDVRTKARSAARWLEERLRRRSTGSQAARDLAILALLEAGATYTELATLRSRDVVRQQPTAVVVFRHGRRSVRLALDGVATARLVAYLRRSAPSPADLVFPGRRLTASPDLFRKVLERWSRECASGSTSG